MIHRYPLLALALLLALPASAAVYRVDNVLGDDAADGVKAPVKTIARALPWLKPGDTLLLTPNPEPYRESIPLHTHGTAAAPIVIDGGGATITGSDPVPRDGWAVREGLYARPQAAEVRFLFGPEVRYEKGASPTVLKPLEWFWKSGELLFRPEEGKTPADYALEMSVRISGVLTTGAGQIIVRNLTARHFYNDGFNIHSGSAPMWFENIRGVWNGDEGFSAHENCECYVRGAEFSDNYWHGIADVGAARTHYQNIVCRDNRAVGILFMGGMHSVSDSQVSGSPQQVVLSASTLEESPRLEDYPLRTSLSHLRSVLTESGPTGEGVVVKANAVGVFEHCVLLGGGTGLHVAPQGRAHVTNSIVSGAQLAEVQAEGSYAADYNLYFPGRLSLAGTAYGPEQIAAYRAASGNDTHSHWQQPKFIPGTHTVSVASLAVGNAFNAGGFGGPDIGLEPRGPRPAEPGVQPAPPSADLLTALGGVLKSGADDTTRICFDFETHNTWSLLYPEPARTDAGGTVAATSVLSEQQAHGGRRSARVQVRTPEGPPRGFTIKVFSQRLPLTRPVAALRFWVHAVGKGEPYSLRLRDGGGESFYGPSGKLDWTGWRELTWDLRQSPPVNHLGGNGNKLQDCPPLEVIMDLGMSASSELVLYLDDLEIELGTH